MSGNQRDAYQRDAYQRRGATRSGSERTEVGREPLGDTPADRQEPPRPIPAVSVSQWVQWVQWVGLGRLVAAALSVVVIAGGMWWLLRAPSVPPEQTLPYASTASPNNTLATSTPPTLTSESDAVPVAGGFLVVHVAGEVMVPGVYELDDSARVADAIEVAGGLGPLADDGALNLAAPLVDGARVLIPAKGSASDEVAASVAPVVEVPPSAGGASAGGPNSPVNLNTADAAALEQLPGVGPATAAAIVEDRARNGPFGGVDDLDRVSGIGPAKLAALRDLVTTS